MLDSARDFVYRNARLLERHRFAFLFERGSAEPVRSALVAYQNPDGGFGHGLEPDLRGPSSQPIPAWTALWILDEIGSLNPSTLRPLLRYLQTIERPGGGVPFVLPSASHYPHAVWWETRSRQPGSALNPTAGIAAVLHKHRLTVPWLARADRFCWDRIGRLREVSPYELRVVLSFLDYVPERERAREELERLRPMILKGGVVERNVRKQGDVFRPLDFAPQPNRLSRELFSQSEVVEQLDLLERQQESDGGWDVHFPIWTPITRFEWRGVQTVEMLKVLKANGRLRGA